MTAPNPEATPTTPTGGTSPAPALSERGWGKLFIALALFIVVPMIPHVRAILPVEDTMLLFVPALAACTLVGWWAGGRAFLAIVWVGLAVGMAVQPAGVGGGNSFYNLERGWSLLLAGSFGLVCLFNPRRGLFGRASFALAVTLVLAAVMSLVGPVTMSRASKTVGEEFTRRNAETMSKFRAAIDMYPQQWQEMVAKVPTLGDMPAETDKQLTTLASAGVSVFPALLALQSLAALALAWATYHRLSRARLGNPLRLREQAREPWTFPTIETLAQDVRHALRLMRRDPAFTFAALATLALGIGLNTAIFSVAYGVLWRPLPFPDPDRLVIVSSAQQTEAGVKTFWTWAPVSYEALRPLVTTLEHLAAYSSIDACRSRRWRRNVTLGSSARARR